LTKKNTYRSDELPDGILEEFEEVRDAFLLLIAKLAEKHGPRSINAGLARAHLELLRIAGGKHFKEVLMSVVDFYIKEAEKIKGKE
jgi:hypothetical protein